LIIASALENKCKILYTEDMQDGQIIEGKLKIENPFKRKF
jgi:predicted nucleic acid-binding protein